MLAPQVKTESGSTKPSTVSVSFTSGSVSYTNIGNAKVPAVISRSNGNLESEKVPINRILNSNTTPVHNISKSERRSAHNAIERRYRTSINDRIIELKDLLVGPDTKVCNYIVNSAIKEKHILYALIANNSLEKKSIIKCSSKRRLFANDAIFTL